MPTTFANTIDGNEILAKRSQCDYAGNDIQTTYATKGELPTATSDLTNDSNFITSADIPVKDVQIAGTSVVNAQGIAEISIPQAGVLDVKVNDSSVVNAQGVADIDLSGYATTQALTSGLAAKQDTISDLSTIRSGAQAGASAVQPGDLKTVAFTGSYSDLTNKPSIPTATSDLTNDSNYITAAQAPVQDVTVNGTSVLSNGVAAVAVPTATSDITNDSGYITISDVPAQVQANWTESDSSAASYIANKPQNLVQDASYVHTDENFTSAEKTKLAGIAAGAEVNVQSNWAETDNASDTYIANKPQNLVQDASYVHTDNNFTSAEKTKLSGIEAGAQVNTVTDVEVDGVSVVSQGVASITLPTVPVTDVTVNGTSVVSNGTAAVTVPAQVNADWNSSSGASEILNKPTIPSGAQLVPAATSADADKVLTVNAQGTPAWATAQAPISAGSGIEITNNVVSAKVDGTTIDTNASGELTVIGGGGSQVNSDWDATSGVAEILNKPDLVDIVAGPGIVVDNPDGNTLRVSQAANYEVELFSGTATNTDIVLNEALDNFDRIKIYAYWKGTNTYDYYGYSVTEIYTSELSVGRRFAVNVFCNLNDSEFYSIANFSVASTKTQLNLVNVKRASLTEQLISNNDGPTVYKVVGIHRIANN